jgi:hypothetical protein
VETSKTTLSTKVTATVQDSAATLKINGIPWPSGQQSFSIPLVKDDTRITIEVRAQNGNSKTYRVDVEKD